MKKIQLTKIKSGWLESYNKREKYIHFSKPENFGIGYRSEKTVCSYYPQHHSDNLILITMLNNIYFVVGCRHKLQIKGVV